VFVISAHRADLGASSGTVDVDDGSSVGDEDGNEDDDEGAGGVSAGKRLGGTMRRRCGSI